jgi:hypothetical protein
MTAIKTKLDCMVPSEIVYPLPGEKGRFVTTVRADSQGNFKLNLRITKTGRYLLQATDVSTGRTTQPVAIQVLPKCECRADIKLANRIIRASVIAATAKEDVQRCLDDSKLYCDLATDSLKRTAIKEYEKTSKCANKRLEQLRLREHGRVLTVGTKYGGIALSSSEKKARV